MKFQIAITRNYRIDPYGLFFGPGFNSQQVHLNALVILEPRDITADIVGGIKFQLRGRSITESWNKSIQVGLYRFRRDCCEYGAIREVLTLNRTNKRKDDSFVLPMAA